MRPLEYRNGGIELTVWSSGDFTGDMRYLEQGFPILGLNNWGDGTEGGGHMGGIWKGEATKQEMVYTHTVKR